ncbi:MAG: hypothetical protein Q4C61_06650 [Lachnospiraceae bacterium]|nr:hypothetical protein [Lachnospiraceae bacterium]
MEKLKEKERKTVKVIQYLMLAVFFGLAFILPAYGVKRQAEENARAGTEQSGGAGAEQNSGAGQSSSAGTGQNGGASAGQSGSAAAEQSSGAGTEQNGGAGTEPGNENKEAAGKKDGSGEKGTIVLDAGHGGTQLRK